MFCARHYLPIVHNFEVSKIVSAPGITLDIPLNSDPNFFWSILTHSSAKIKNSESLGTRQLVHFHWRGLICWNAHNPETCRDYEIRMCCPEDWDCQWEAYGECDKECGGGSKTRVSSCLNDEGRPKKLESLK